MEKRPLETKIIAWLCDYATVVVEKHNFQILAFLGISLVEDNFMRVHKSMPLCSIQFLQIFYTTVALARQV